MSEKNQSLSGGSVLVLRDGVYYVDLLNLERTDFSKDYAYLDGDYFYLFRGTKPLADMDKPGVYIDAISGKAVKVDPVTDEEKEFYSSDGKVVTHDPSEAAKFINENEDIFIPVAESTRLFNPEILITDDILKRMLKLLFIEKEIDIDNYKDRFPDKNALFNFKQVMKNPDSRVTMKIFERACDVVGVEYVITVREKQNTIGKKMGHDLSVSSEDTYEFGSIPATPTVEDADE